MAMSSVNGKMDAAGETSAGGTTSDSNISAAVDKAMINIRGRCIVKLFKPGQEKLPTRKVLNKKLQNISGIFTGMNSMCVVFLSSTCMKQCLSSPKMKKFSPVRCAFVEIRDFIEQQFEELILLYEKLDDECSMTNMQKFEVQKRVNLLEEELLTDRKQLNGELPEPEATGGRKVRRSELKKRWKRWLYGKSRRQQNTVPVDQCNTVPLDQRKTKKKRKKQKQGMKLSPVAALPYTDMNQITLGRTANQDLLPHQYKAVTVNNAPLSSGDSLNYQTANVHVWPANMVQEQHVRQVQSDTKLYCVRGMAVSHFNSACNGHVQNHSVYPLPLGHPVYVASGPPPPYIANWSGMANYPSHASYGGSVGSVSSSKVGVDKDSSGWF